MPTYNVICIGSATVDHFLTVEQPLSSLRLGDKILVKSVQVYSGGGATNAGAALATLGLKVKILSKLGNDHDAGFIRKELQYYNVQNICCQHSRHSTDFSTIISSTKEKDRIIFVHKGASRDLHLTDFRHSQLRASWFYVGGLMGESFKTGKWLVRYAQEKRINVLFNPSLYVAKKGKKALGGILRRTTILVLNEEEAQALLGTKSTEINFLLTSLQRLGPETVVITNGSKKLFALHHQTIYSLPPPEVKVVHTAGAGDAFTAGLLAGLIKNYSFEDALRLGQVNASSVIQHIGCKNILLTEKEARKRMGKYRIKVEKKKLH